MKITSRSTLIDVCFAVSTALERSGTTAVLTGGSAATYYAPDRYQSRDADFVLTMVTDARAAAVALQSLGFAEHSGVYRHPDTEYTVEFPSGPLSAGSTILSELDTVRRGPEILHILSCTDSVRDRLAAFFHWGDRGSLRTALDVAKSGPIDLTTIERWSAAERSSEKFQEFKTRYEEREPTREQAIDRADGRDLGL